VCGLFYAPIKNERLNMDAETLKWLVIMGGIILIFILVIIGSKHGWFSNFKAGKDGIEFSSNQNQKRARVEKLRELLKKTIDDQDDKLEEYAQERADILRSGIKQYLDQFIRFPSGQRSLSGAIRIPLYNANRRNKFVEKLRPEKIEQYLDCIMKDIADEYGEVEYEQKNYECPIHSGQCIVLSNIFKYKRSIEKAGKRKMGDPHTGKAYRMQQK
jgi:hypothetical protein